MQAPPSTVHVLDRNFYLEAAKSAAWITIILGVAVLLDAAWLIPIPFAFWSVFYLVSGLRTPGDATHSMEN